ncbi:MAG: hypothetical protein CM1200mP18_20240 [Gammaproteobacteria bacterium]|nr:MAG: hypothetical protein CM1200mP18_20240 [Gammaproteobacteria bacterium]
MLWTIPNLLTLLRVGLIPVLVVMYYLPINGCTSLVFFLLAGLTDWLDGFSGAYVGTNIQVRRVS